MNRFRFVKQEGTSAWKPFLGLIFFCLLAIPIACSEEPSKRDRLDPLRKVAVVEEGVMIPMRDNVRLSTNIARPREPGRYPALLIRTPYGKSFATAPNHVKAGYAFVIQDTRGRYDSEGEFYPFVHEGKDGYDTIEWIAKQPWSDGNVGMSGFSYQASAQLLAAMENPPHLRCIAAAAPATDLDEGTYFYGGALRLELVMAWILGQSATGKRVLEDKVPPDEMNHWMREGLFERRRYQLPLKERKYMDLGGASYGDCWEDIVTHWEDPTRWRDYSPVHHADRIKVPVLLQGGHYDIFARETLALWSALRQSGGSAETREHTYMLLGPWTHTVGAPVGDRNFVDAESARKTLEQQWFDLWLKDKGEARIPWSPLHAYLINSRTWLKCTEWPPADAKQARWFLSKDRLSRVAPEAKPSSQSFTYDPSQPVPTMGGNNLAVARGIRNHSRLGLREDMLRFCTEPLEEELSIAGPIRVKLYVSSSAPDTDFTAMLIDESPEGYEANIADGIARMRYREGRDRPKLLDKDEKTLVEIDLWSTAWTFLKGHRIVLYISSSNFPRFDRNTNTAENPALAKDLRQAVNTVYHDADHPSVLKLWPIPRVD